jgi:ABC-type hemin transport system ATPase subunit
MKKIIQRIMNILINSCKKTAELIEKRAISKLSVTEKVQLQLHKSMCETCTSYEQRSKFLDDAVSKLFSQKTPHDKAHLSEDKKSKILEEIKKQ